MKPIFTSLITCLFVIITIIDNSFAQTTVRISPSSMQNAFIGSLNPSTNYDGYQEFDAIAWTNGASFVARTLVSYDLSAIPPGSTIVSASLSLYADSATSNYQSDAGSNASFLQLITESWNPGTVTWNNQPTSTITDEDTIPMSDSKYENYPDIDVTKLISDLYNNPSTYFGLMIKLEDEVIYNSMVFASSTNVDTAIQPKLYITYTSSNQNAYCLTLKEPKYFNSAFIGSLDPTTNYGTYPEFDAIDWTNGGTPFTARSLIQFDLSSIPSNASIYSASISLFGDSTTSNYQGDAGSNATYLKRITSSWQSDVATWNDQPTTTATDEVLIPQSTSMYENYTDIDITTLVNDIFNSSNNYGLMLQLQSEQTYNSTVFGSSHNTDSSIWPIVQICYTVPTGLNTVSANNFECNVYPNPFYNNLQVSYNLSSASNVTFELYNIIGQEVTEINIGEENAGDYQYSFNPNQDLPSGIYILKAIINNNIVERKVIKD